MQNIKEISDTLRGPKVNARRHWDGEKGMSSRSPW